MRHSISLGLILFGVWLLWSGHFEPLLISLGAISCLAVVLVGRKMRVVDAEGVPVGLLPRILLYVPWILWEVVKANIAVAKVILDPKLPIRPRVVHVQPTQRTDLGRVLHANSITLTPGTVSIFVDDETIAVHALTEAAAEDLLAGAIDRHVTRVEGGR